MLDRNKNLFGNTHWGAFSVTEGIFRVLNLGFLKIIAAFLLTPVLGFIVVAVIGLVRLIGGILLTLRSGFEIYPNKQAVLGSMLAGLIVAYTTLIPIYVFFSADVSITVFAIVLIAGLVPSALISKYRARGKLNSWQIGGGVITLIGLWALTDFAKTDLFISTPLWVWLILTLPIAALIKDIITRTIGTAGVISAWVHNVWVGLSMVVFSVVGLISFNAAILLEGLFLNNLPNYLWMVILSGVFYLITVFARQKSLRVMGGVLAKKKFIMIITLIIVSLVVDLFFFGILPVGIVLESILLVLIGYVVVDNLLLKK